MTMRNTVRRALSVSKRFADDVKGRVGSVNQQPVIVLGNQKSGTTAIAALLAQLTDSTVTLDIGAEIRRQDLIRVARDEMSFEAFLNKNRDAFSKDIVKHPNLTLVYDQIRPVFPDAKYVFVVRDPRDNIRSIFDRLALDGHETTLSEATLDLIPPAWQRVLSVDWLGMDSRNHIEASAKRWSHLAKVYLDAPNEMLLCRYEEFATDKEGFIREVAATLGLEAGPRSELELDRQFQPAGRSRDVSWAEFFGDVNLKTIEDTCTPEMVGLGYSI